MANNVEWPPAERLEEPGEVPHGGGHRVILVALRVVRIALAEAVDGDDAEVLRELREVQMKILRVRAAGGVALGAAVHQDDGPAPARFEIARSDAVNVYPFLAELL